MNLPEIKVPKNLHCPVCGQSVANASAVRSAPNPQFKKGMVIICSGCTVTLQVGDSGLVQMKPDQVNALSPQSKAAIAATKLTLIRILEKNKKTVDIKSS